MPLHIGVSHIFQCTIHQPSAVLFDAFDSLVLLAKGGKMTYFGESKLATHLYGLNLTLH